MIGQDVIRAPQNEVITVPVHLLLALSSKLHLLVSCTWLPPCQDGPVIVLSEVGWALKHLGVAEACHCIELQPERGCIHSRARSTAETQIQYRVCQDIAWQYLGGSRFIQLSACGAKGYCQLKHETEVVLTSSRLFCTGVPDRRTRRSHFNLPRACSHTLVSGCKQES